MNLRKIFDYLRGEYQQRFNNLVRTVEVPTDSESEARERILVNGVYRLYFDERTHDVSIENGEIIVAPKDSKIAHGTGEIRRVFSDLLTVEETPIVAYLQSDGGQRKIIEIVKTAQRNKEI